ncbi:MAG: hypothetical protein ACYDB3_09715 [Acidimicrobiales bacterium]
MSSWELETELDDERSVGDLSERDYLDLRDHYTARAAVVLRALDAGTQPGPGSEPPGRRRSVPREPGAPIWRRRRILVGGALGLFAVATVVLVVAEVSVRLPGQTASGTLSLNQAQRLQRTLAQAATLEAGGHAAEALALYHQVLRRDPTQEQALAESGWLEYEAGVQARNAGLLARGQRDEQAAEAADPGAFAPHLYLGSILLVEGQPAAAAARFLAAGAPTAEVQAAWPFIVKAYTQAALPVPAPPPGVSAGR